jgi:hypothetical protein
MTILPPPNHIPIEKTIPKIRIPAFTPHSNPHIKEKAILIVAPITRALDSARVFL